MTALAYADDWERSASGLLVPTQPRRRVYDRPVAIDLFAGAGGFSCGFHQAGWHVVAAVEFDHTAAMTYMINLARPGVRIHYDTPEREEQFAERLEKAMGPSGKAKLARPMVAGSGWIAGQPDDDPGCEHFFIGDVRNFTGARILEAIGMEVGEVGCVFGGPPCQGFSAAGKQDVMDPRNSLVFEFTRLVCEIMPKTMVLENVPRMAAMVTPEGIPVLDALALTLQDGGWGTYDGVRKAMQSMPGARAATRVTAKKQTQEQGCGPVEDREPDLLDLIGAAS